MLRLPSSDGVDLAVHELGPDPQGPAVLLAHATGLHGRVWAPLAHALTGRACWAPDLRGHGDSTGPIGGSYAWNGFADDVLAVVDGLALERPFGVGHSKGGAALVLAEARRPGTFRGLWLFEPVIFPPGFPPTGENPLAAGARRRRARFESYEAAEANYASKPPFGRLDPEARKEYVTHGLALQPDGSVVLKCRPEVEAQVFEMAAGNGAWSAVEQVRCPVTVVQGAVGEPGPAAFAAEVAERLPVGRLEMHPELGHFGPLQDPRAMARSVLAADRLA